MRHTLEYGLEGNSKPKISEILGALFAKMRCLIEKVRVSLSLVGYVWLFLLQFLRFDDLPKPLLITLVCQLNEQSLLSEQGGILLWKFWKEQALSSEQVGISFKNSRNEQGQLTKGVGNIP